MNGNQDPADEMGPGDTLSSTESLDPDDVRNADDDTVVAPPEDWRAADKYGMTEREQRMGEPHATRLDAEEPDVTADRRNPDAGPPTEEFSPLDTSAVVTDENAEDTDPRPTRQHRGQVDDTPEDGESYFPIVE
ncbi:hypothetical protein [Nocardia otitidiscaviarum]|uniref:hypothetical protein n=1 Tax=Nocardia otitidiscaviarum TaxID=1823 RepID=UPI001893D727|nr:hypothetical protein [Nocardia otitidiscaviarum]MBF6181339.1 hypothetical protein [Nocardia otitidiscaviarum]